MQPFLHTSMYIVIHTNAVLPGLISALLVLSAIYLFMEVSLSLDIILCGSPQWGAADAEIKVPSGENTELKRSPCKAWSSQYIAIHATLTARDFFLSCLFLHFRSIHLPFFQNLSRFFLCWLRLTHGSCVSPQNKIGHSAGCRFPC